MSHPLPLHPPSDITNPQLRALYGYWRDLREKRRAQTGFAEAAAVPLKADLDPADIKELLPYVMLVECYEGRTRFRFRLVGTHVAFGKDPTGLFLDEGPEPGPYRDHIIELFTRGAQSPHGLYSEYEYGYTDIAGPKLISRLFLPLIGPPDIPEMMLVGQVREDSPSVKRSAWQAQPGTIEERVQFRIEE